MPEPFLPASSFSLDAAAEIASSQVAALNAPSLRTNGVTMRSRWSFRGAKRPNSHSRPLLTGASQSPSMRSRLLSRTIISTPQPTLHAAQVVLMRWTSFSRPRNALARSISAPVGHTCTHVPHEMQVLSPSGTPRSAMTIVRAPRSSTPSVKLPTSSPHARMQRRHRMQRLLSSMKSLCEASTGYGVQLGCNGQWVIPSP